MLYLVFKTASCITFNFIFFWCKTVDPESIEQKLIGKIAGVLW